MIKNIVFDMGNVLILYDAKQILARHGITSEEEVELIKRDVFGSAAWREYDRGTVTKEAFREVIDALPPRLSEICDRLIMQQCFAQNEMPPFPQMCDLIRRLKESGYKIYLLSNAGKDFEIYSKGIPAFQYFDGKFVSSDYLLLKPEREIYEKFFEVFSLDPSECVFIDDVPENVEGSKKCGMDAICFNSSLEELSGLEAELTARGVKF